MINSAFLLVSHFTLLLSTEQVDALATAPNIEFTSFNTLISGRPWAIDASCPPLSLVKSLANRNIPPKMVEGKLHFSPEHDWKEDARVFNDVIPNLTRNVDQEWDALVAHINDERYCVTVFRSNGAAQIWTVGHVCRQVIGRTLNAGNLESLPRIVPAVYRRAILPDIALNGTRLSAWYRDRKDLPLYELQAQICESLAKKLSNEYKDLAKEEDRLLWIDLLERKAKSLREQKSDIKWMGFSPEELRPFRREDASMEPER